jgi:hypothetical protein
MAKPPFSPNPILKVQLFEFTHYNDRVPLEATTRKLNNYAVLFPLLIQQGWQVLPLVIIANQNHHAHPIHPKSHRFTNSWIPSHKSPLHTSDALSSTKGSSNQTIPNFISLRIIPTNIN